MLQELKNRKKIKSINALELPKKLDIFGAFLILK
jgi:hypothetical protein